MPGCAIRTAVSAGPPGGNGTMMRMGFDGKRLREGRRRGSHGAASERGRMDQKRSGGSSWLILPVLLAASVAPRPRTVSTRNRCLPRAALPYVARRRLPAFVGSE